MNPSGRIIEEIKLMQQQHPGDLKRLLLATVYSARGLRAAFRNEAAFRQEVLMVLVLLPIAFWLGETALQKALLAFTLLLVLVVELLNSAIETVVDRIGTQDHPLSGQAKDMGSAAVLLSLMATALVWGIVAWQRWMG
jgi:diacylglycerol kinase (ATP)